MTKMVVILHRFFLKRADYAAVKFAAGEFSCGRRQVSLGTIHLCRKGERRRLALKSLKTNGLKTF